MAVIIMGQVNPKFSCLMWNLFKNIGDKNAKFNFFPNELAKIKIKQSLKNSGLQNWTNSPEESVPIQTWITNFYLFH